MSGELVQKNYLAGNLTIKNRFLKNPNRYYQEDFFNTLPTIENIPEVDLNQKSNSGDTPDTAAYSHTRKVILLTRKTDSNGISIAANTSTNLYTLFNNLITENSVVIFHLKSMNSDPVTGIESPINNGLNAFLSVVIKKIHNGYVEFSIRNDSNSVIPSTGTAIHRILCSVDPQLPINPHWTIKGTNVSETNIYRAEGALGTGILMSTAATQNDQCILAPRNSDKVFNYNHLIVTVTQNYDLNINSTSSSINISVNISSTGITNQKHINSDIISKYFKIGHPVYKASTTTGNLGSSGYKLVGILTGITGTSVFKFENTGLLAPLKSGDVLFPNNNVNPISLDRFWSISSQMEFECAIRTPNVLSNFCFWAGWKLTTDNGTHNTDNNQAYFFYDNSGNTLSTGLDTNVKNKLFFVYSINGIQNPKRITQIKITGNTDNDGVLLSNTFYKFRIVINKDRTISAYVDKHQDTHSIRNTTPSTAIQVSLDSDSSPKDSTQYKLLTAGDTPSSYINGTVDVGKTYGNPIGSNELSSNFNSDVMNEKELVSTDIIKNYVSINYFPVVGIQNVGTTSIPTYMTLSYIKCSKLLTEDDTDYKTS